MELNISNKFKAALCNKYAKNLHFACILRLLSFLNRLSNGNFSLEVYNINFNIRNSLLYYILLFKALCLCIFNIYIKILLFIVYNKNYFGFNYIYNKLCSFCILHLIKKVLNYIKYCLSCLLNIMLRT